MSHLAWEIRITLVSIFALLAVSNFTLFLKIRYYPGSDDTLIRHRIGTWWVLAALFSLALCTSPTGGVIFFGFISFFALKEFLSMSPTRRADRRVLFYAYLSVIPQYYCAATDNYRMFLVFIPVIMFAWLPTRMWMIGQGDGFQKASGTLLWALMITVYSLSHAAYLLAPAWGQAISAGTTDGMNPNAHYPGPGLLIFLVILAEANDIFQYMSGKPFGKKQLSPNIAPSKTYAGFAGGITLTTCLAGLIGPLITPMDLAHSLFAGLMIACMGFAGELCICALKQDLKITNFGATLPGHGGVLDRVGNLIFTAPLFFHFTHYCYHQ